MLVKSKRKSWFGGTKSWDVPNIFVKKIPTKTDSPNSENDFSKILTNELNDDLNISNPKNRSVSAPISQNSLSVRGWKKSIEERSLSGPRGERDLFKAPTINDIPIIEKSVSWSPQHEFSKFNVAYIYIHKSYSF